MRRICRGDGFAYVVVGKSTSTSILGSIGERDDFVGRAENINMDWKTVMAKTNLGEIGHLGRHSGHPSYEYAYDEKMREMMLQRYEENFRRWY